MTGQRTWRDALLARLRLSSDSFQEFVLYLLRLYGLELERVGGSGDEGSTVSASRRSVRCSPREWRSK